MTDSKAEIIYHINVVQKALTLIIIALMERVLAHDLSKLKTPELEILEEYAQKLRGTTYGSDEYKKYFDAMKPALNHHYAENRHHPEHFLNGVDNMNLVDVIEMFCDWFAITKRYADGDIMRNIKLNSERFRLSPQMVNILTNTAELFLHLELGREI